MLQDTLEEVEEEEEYEDFLAESEPADEDEIEEVSEEEYWYYMLDEQLYGPVTVDELLLMRNEGMVDLSIQISRDGQSGWTSMAETELTGLQRDTNDEEVD